MALGLGGLGSALLPGAATDASGPGLVESILAAMQPQGGAPVVAAQQVAAPGSLSPGSTAPPALSPGADVWRSIAGALLKKKPDYGIFDKSRRSEFFSKPARGAL